MEENNICFLTDLNDLIKSGKRDDEQFNEFVKNL